MPRTLLPLFLGVLICFAFQKAQAQSFATRPLAVFVVQVHGSSSQHPLRRTHLGSQLTPYPVYRGGISQVSGKVIAPYADDFSNGFIQQLPSTTTNPPEKYYLHFWFQGSSGYIADVASFENGNIHCDNDLPSFIEVGDSFYISRHRRLSEVFTADNSYGFGAGESAAQSDNIAIFNPDLQKVELFYFNSLRSRWEKEGVPEDANNHFIRFPYGLYVIRRTPGMIRMVLQGFVPETPVLLPVQTGFNLFSFPIDSSSSVSNRINSEGLFSAQGGPNAASADLFTFHEATSIEPQGPFYLSSATNTPTWLKTGNSNSNIPSFVTDPLSSLQVFRQGPPGFIQIKSQWFHPTPDFTLDPNPSPGETPPVVTLRFGPFFGLIPEHEPVGIHFSSDLRDWNSDFDDAVYISGDTLTYTSSLWFTGQRRFYFRVQRY